jgi:hypothetical protein
LSRHYLASLRWAGPARGKFWGEGAFCRRYTPTHHAIDGVIRIEGILLHPALEPTALFGIWRPARPRARNAPARSPTHAQLTPTTYPPHRADSQSLESFRATQDVCQDPACSPMLQTGGCTAIMVRKLSRKGFYQIKDPKNFRTAMRDDVQLLLSHQRYISLSTVIVCCLDALAAGTGKATRGRFESFVGKHFPGLCAALQAACPGRKGAAILYDEFRNGFAHLRSPKSKFAVAEDHELSGDWADEVEVDGKGQFVAINIDRLAREFLTLP